MHNLEKAFWGYTTLLQLFFFVENVCNAEHASKWQFPILSETCRAFLNFFFWILILILCSRLGSG